MNFSQAKKIIPELIKMDKIVCLWGKAGIGKTEFVRSLAKEMGIDLKILHPVVDESVDYKGLPFIAADKRSAEFLPYGDMLSLMTAEKPLLVFIDDFGQASQDVHKALMHVLQGREINGKKISDQVRFVLASNREQDSAGVNRLISPMKSRIAVHLEIEADHKDWILWGIDNGIHPAVLGFVSWKPAAMHSFDRKSHDNTYSCARTLEHLSDVLHSNVLSQVPEAELDLVAGIIGAEHASTFVGFLRVYRDMPDPLKILADPLTADLPTEISAQWAICSALAHKATRGNFENALIYLKRFANEAFEVIFIMLAEKVKPEIKNTPVYIDWQVKNQSVTLNK